MKAETIVNLFMKGYPTFCKQYTYDGNNWKKYSILFNKWNIIPDEEMNSILLDNIFSYFKQKYHNAKYTRQISQFYMYLNSLQNKVFCEKILEECKIKMCCNSDFSEPYEKLTGV